MIKGFSNVSLIVVLGLMTVGCSRLPAAQAKATASVSVQLVETEVSNGGLSGAYINAGVDSPIVIIVPGSGPTDRDGNNGGMISNALKFLAEGLAQSGVSSIRVDKRGLFSSVAGGNANAVDVSIYGEDYRGWIKTALEMTGQNCAFLLGHSEGGLMVSAAALGQSNVCGVVTLASPGRRLSDVLREQLKSNPANKRIMKQAETAIQSLESGEKIDISKFHPALQGWFYPDVQGFLISLFSVDPAQLLAAVDAPALVIQGEHDLQVSTADAQRLSNVSGAELVMVSKMNHVLKTSPKRRSANIKAYNSPEVPIDARVTDAVTKFVNENK